MEINQPINRVDSRTCARKLLDKLDSAINNSLNFKQPQLTACMFWMTFSQTPRVYFPILLCHIFVLITLHNIPFFSIPLISFEIDSLLPSERLHPPIVDDSSKIILEKDKIKKSFLPLPDKDEDKVNRLWVVIGIAILMILLLAIITYCFLRCIRAGCSKILRILYHFNFIMYFSVFPLFFIQEIVYVQNWPTDIFLLIIILYNFCFCGVLAMFYTFPKIARKFYLILLCAMTSTISIKLISDKLLIPIVILFCLWDCYAVLNKSGPLNQILQQDGHNALPVVFQYLIWFNAEKIKSNTSFSTKFKRFDSTDDNDDDSLEIGLGDFIFYTIVVGKAFLYVGFFSSILVCMFLFIGVAITTIILNFSKNGFPALPIPLFLALLPLIFSSFTIQPMRDQIIKDLIFI